MDYELIASKSTKNETEVFFLRYSSIVTKQTLRGARFLLILQLITKISLQGLKFDNGRNFNILGL